MSATGEASSSMSTDGRQARLDSTTSMQQQQLSPALVGAWLDAHPDFLNDYLKKLQLQRRTSIMSDKSSHLLASLHSNLISYNRSHFSQSASLLVNEAPPSPLTSASASLYALNRTPSVFECGKRLSNVNEYQQPSASSINTTHQSGANNISAAAGVAATAATASSTAASSSTALTNSNNTTSGGATGVAAQQTGLNTQFTFMPAAFNLSFSEPNLQPAVRAQLAHQQHLQLQLQQQQQQQTANTNAFDALPNQQSQQQQQQQQQQLVPRKKFKQLSLYEKMYTLVKTLYQSLDLKSTCKKILNTVSLLLDADRCSLFLVVDDEKAESKKCLVSVVFDAQSNSDLLMQNNIEMNEKELEQARERSRKRQQLRSESSDDECNDGGGNEGQQIKIEYGRGIAGWVAQTGQSLNIEDAYEDARFNSTIDKQTGYRTRSILCLPIMNERGQCIAVAEAINKLNDNDELVSQSSSSSLSSSSSNNAVYCFTKQDEEVIAEIFSSYIYYHNNVI
jgi:hypothetical protein